ncbi:hypothetical protein [Rhodanobacter caeni]|uniref:Thioredoxin domain-containing protein n=1 Tax=Rhodanobacter caeni TaxID=657654 RepID=A0ABN0UQY5_9GAMM
MKRLPQTIALFVLHATLALAPAPAPALAAQPPIRSEAALTRYLQHTPAGTSPLDRLSPGARKRFLAQLDFGPRGLRSIPLRDLDEELTHPQIVQLLALFGAQEYATAGLAPAEHARRENERRQDAGARGCTVTTCAESDLEQRYDQFVLYQADFAMPEAQRFTLAGQRYDKLFGRYQIADRLHSLGAVDLRLLKRAADEAVYYVPSDTHISQLRMDLDEMQRRHMATDKDYSTLHQALVARRDFDGAKMLALHHRGMETEAVPTFRKPVALPAGQPTALTVDMHDGTMTRQAFDLSRPLSIVVVASCHFSRDAARAIEADAQLRPIFAADAIWLASQGERLSAVIDWNREFPDQPIHVAWQDSEWSMLDSWAMPTFYVFRHGRLVKKFSGWSNATTLKQSLQAAGVLH